jgi:hypothetical protein
MNTNTGMPTIYNIKGSCEYCGYAYMGELHCRTMAFEPIACPNCGKDTMNFDEARTVDERDKDEHYGLTYNNVKRFTISSE